MRETTVVFHFMTGAVCAKITHAEDDIFNVVQNAIRDRVRSVLNGDYCDDGWLDEQIREDYEETIEDYDDEVEAILSTIPRIKYSIITDALHFDMDWQAFEAIEGDE